MTIDKKLLWEMAVAQHAAFKPNSRKEGLCYFVLTENRWTPMGWVEVLPRPGDYEPNVLFVSVATGRVFKTVCGNAQNGAVDFIEM